MVAQPSVRKRRLRILSGEQEDRGVVTQPSVRKSAHVYDLGRRGRWLIVLSWSVLRGRVECVGVELRSHRQDDEELGFSWGRLEKQLGDPRPVTATLWREFAIGGVIDKARRDARTTVERLLAGNPALQPRLEKESSMWRPSGGRPPEYSPAHFVKVADTYADAWRRGWRNPTQEVAQKFHVSHSTAAKWVARARTKGLLGPTEKGRAGGVALAKARGSGRRR